MVDRSNYLGTVFNYTGSFKVKEERDLKALNVRFQNLKKSIQLSILRSVNCVIHFLVPFLAMAVRFGDLGNIMQSNVNIISFAKD